MRFGAKLPDEWHKKRGSRAKFFRLTVIRLYTFCVIGFEKGIAGRKRGIVPARSAYHEAWEMAHGHEHGHGAEHASGQGSDTIDQLIAHYVAGTLPAPMRALVGSHIEIKEKGRRLAGGFEALAGRELETMAPEALSDRDARLKAIFESPTPAIRLKPRAEAATCDIFPKSLVGFTGYTAKDVPWRTKLPGLREVRFPETDGFQATLYWIRAGRAMPHHTHGGSEVTLVLDGGFSDGIGHYLRGDVAAADETVEHRPVADDDAPCICFAVTTADLKMTGSLRQLFSDIFGR